jgi:hypothetical protein
VTGRALRSLEGYIVRGQLDRDFFFMAEVNNAAKVPHAERQDPVSGISTGRSSAVVYQFDNQQVNTGVSGLHGCTSVMVVSQMGAYASHFWERPAFNRDRFGTDVLRYLQYGDGTSVMPGLQQHTGSGRLFDTAFDPHIVLIVPRRRGSPYPGDYMFPNEIQRILATLRGMLPSVTPFIYKTTPLQGIQVSCRILHRQRLSYSTILSNPILASHTIARYAQPIRRT